MPRAVSDGPIELGGRCGVTLWALRDKIEPYGNDIGGCSPRFHFRDSYFAFLSAYCERLDTPNTFHPCACPYLMPKGPQCDAYRKHHVMPLDRNPTARRDHVTGRYGIGLDGMRFAPITSMFESEWSKSLEACGGRIIRATFYGPDGEISDIIEVPGDLHGVATVRQWAKALKSESFIIEGLSP